MGYAKILIENMRFNEDYSVEELSVMTNIPREEVSRVVKLLVKGGVLDITHNDRALKERKVESRQMSFFK